ncbi:hypothetical protein [Saccharopolyspora sp. NPDC002686]|uniref:hypothetical protein n=1 Tax=Saccharopolyspora sp. NPDC002686 TaxID=3154541 RepID=UPI003323EC71
MSARSRVRRLVGLGLPLLAIAGGLVVARYLLPSSSAPGYAGVPNTCEAVSAQALRKAFEPGDAEIHDERHDAEGQRPSSKCQWRVRGEQRTRLHVEMAVEFDRETRPDTTYVDDFLDYLELEPGAASAPDLDARAVLIRSPRDVQLVAARANMTVAVRYTAPGPAPHLEAVAHQVAEDLLATAGRPE